MTKFRGVCIGAGYFSSFQYEAWNRNMERAKPVMEEHYIARHYTDYREMLEKEKSDFSYLIHTKQESGFTHESGFFIYFDNFDNTLL